MLDSKPFSETVIKLILPFLLLVVLVLVAVFFVFLPMAEDYVLERRKEALEDFSLMAWSTLTYYHDLEQSNVYSPELARELAKNHIRKLRYGQNKKHYFWIIDMRGITIMNPYRPDHEGVNQAHLSDIDGKFFIKDFINTARKRGEGFVEYKWQLNDDPNQIEKKISHVRIFSPWGWIIGTGFYFDHSYVNITDLLWVIVLILFFIVAFVSVFYFYIIRNFITSEKIKRTSFEKLLTKESKIRALLEAIPDMIMRIDKEGVVLDYKEPLNFNSFIDPAEILDKKIADTWPEKIAEKVLYSIKKAFDTATPQKLIFIYPVSSSKNMRIESHFVMSDKNEILATFRDITKRNK